MARALRIVWKGAWYHITARGNERGVIFLDDEDRRHLLGMLARMTERYRILLHVYTLMDNHYHLVLETPDANLSAARRGGIGSIADMADGSIGAIGVAAISWKAVSRGSF